MKFKDSHKAVFLPVCEKVLCQYKGFVMNEEMLPDLSEKDVYNIRKEFTNKEPEGGIRIFFVLLFLLPMLPFIIVGAIIDTYNNNEKYLSRIYNRFISLLCFILRKKVEIDYHKYAKEKYKEIREEDVPDFITHCHSYLAKVYLYSYTELSDLDKQRVNDLIEKGTVQGIQIIDKLSDLSGFVHRENISLHNSFLVLLSEDEDEVTEAKKLGFNDKMLMARNIELWGKRDLSGDHSLRWNSRETLVSMKEYVFHYIHAKKNVYFDNKTVIFIEEYKDEFLNNYLTSNYESLCARFKEKGMRFIYFPALKNGLSDLPEELFVFLKFRIPYLYNLSNTDLKELITHFISNIDEQAFYACIVDPLELPYFKRPCLLRSMAGGWKDSENRFTYKPLIYHSEEDLNNLFDQYFKQLVIPNDEEGVAYRRERAPAEYDTDYYFYRDARECEPGFKEKIDLLKAQGNYGVLAEAIIYMIATLKNAQPELLQKIQPLLACSDLTKKSQLLSTIHVDQELRIFLPEYANQEIKLHALPKTVYLLFLKNPNGIRFKELYQYKQELTELYAQISPKSDLDSMRKSIDDLVDCTNPSLNQKCSRIRQEILRIVDEPLANFYYIDGNRGEEKKVKIEDSYIRFD